MCYRRWLLLRPSLTDVERRTATSFDLDLLNILYHIGTVSTILAMPLCCVREVSRIPSRASGSHESAEFLSLPSVLPSQTNNGCLPLVLQQIAQHVRRNAVWHNFACHDCSEVVPTSPASTPTGKRSRALARVMNQKPGPIIGLLVRVRLPKVRRPCLPVRLGLKLRV